MAGRSYAWRAAAVLVLTVSARSWAVESQQVGLPTVLSDGCGMTWDIQHDGHISDGTSDAYDNGIILNVGGQNFPGQRLARAVNAGREIIVGPVAMRKGLRVTRRIYVPRREGYCRFVEVIENTGGSTARPAVAIYTNLGGSPCIVQGSSGANVVGSKDTAFCVDDTHGPGSDPAICTAFAGERATAVPTVSVRTGNCNVRITWTGLEIPAGGSVAIMHIHAQRRSFQEAVSFMKSLKLKGKGMIRSLPREIRGAVVNFPCRCGTHADLPLSVRSDVVELADGGLLYGKLARPAFRIATFFGDFEFQADRVAGALLAGGERDVLVTSDGTSLVGDVRLGAIDFAIAGELPTRLDASRIRAFSYKAPDEDPAALKPPVIELRNGARIAGKILHDKVALRARWGRVEIASDKVAEITFAGDGLHSIRLADGSELTGLVDAESIRFEPAAGSAFSLPVGSVSRITLVAEAEDGDAGLAGRGKSTMAVRPKADLSSRIELAGGDKLRGVIASESLKIHTDFGPIAVSAGRISSVTRQDEWLRFSFELWDAGKLSGYIEETPLEAELDCGVRLKLHPGMIARVRRPCTEVPEGLAARIAALIVELGDKSWPVRSKASQALLEIGRPVLGSLAKALAHEDPEVRVRASKLIDDIMSGRKPEKEKAKAKS